MRGTELYRFPNYHPRQVVEWVGITVSPADVCGDAREEVILYDPYSDAVYIYSPKPFHTNQYEGYKHTPRQYNARLMD